jgi:hypothetical protein
VELDHVAVSKHVVVGNTDRCSTGRPTNGVCELLSQLVVDDIGQVLDGSAAVEDKRPTGFSWATGRFGVHAHDVERLNDTLTQNI